jgi:hypothetical protein
MYILTFFGGPIRLENILPKQLILANSRLISAIIRERLLTLLKLSSRRVMIARVFGIEPLSAISYIFQVLHHLISSNKLGSQMNFSLHILS